MPKEIKRIRFIYRDQVDLEREKGGIEEEKIKINQKGLKIQQMIK